MCNKGTRFSLNIQKLAEHTKKRQSFNTALKYSFLTAGNSTIQKHQYRRHFQGEVMAKVGTAACELNKINGNYAQCVHPETG